MAGRLRPGVTLGADKGYDTQAFVAAPRAEGAPRTWRRTPRTAAVP